MPYSAFASRTNQKEDNQGGLVKSGTKDHWKKFIKNTPSLKCECPLFILSCLYEHITLGK